MTDTQKRVSLTASQFLAGSKLQAVELAGLSTEGEETPVVYVKSAKTKDVMDLAELKDDTTPAGKQRMLEAQYLLVSRCIYDEHGNRLLTDEQAPQLADMPASGFFQILAAATGDMKKLAGGKEGNA